MDERIPGTRDFNHNAQLGITDIGKSGFKEKFGQKKKDHRGPSAEVILLISVVAPSMTSSMAPSA